ncbi:MAG: DNA-binding protein [Prevotellaceae bacterium]|nr:MAG: DNA-binding protein [Prevotellaceae bacterium]
MKVTTKYTEFSQLPLTLTPMDIKEILGISRSNAYALCNSKDFPAVRIGKLFRINRDRFIEWYRTADSISLDA